MSEHAAENGARPTWSCLFGAAPGIDLTGEDASLELSPEQQARLRGVLGGYYGYTDEFVADVLERMAHCHPYDDACGGSGGPCRNHGGSLPNAHDSAPR